MKKIENFKGSYKGTIIQAETHAIQKAGEKLLKENIKGKNIYVYSDCKMALQKLNKTKITDWETRKTIDTWRKLSKTNKIRMNLCARDLFCCQN